MTDQAVLAVATEDQRWRGVTVRTGRPGDVLPVLQRLYTDDDPTRLVVELIDGHPGWDELPDLPLGPAAADFEISPSDDLAGYGWVYVLNGGTVEVYAADPDIAWRRTATVPLG
jgi:hypothetical protein